MHLFSFCSSSLFMVAYQLVLDSLKVAIKLHAVFIVAKIEIKFDLLDLSEKLHVGASNYSCYG